MTAVSQRLSLASLDHVAKHALPGYDPADLAVGIVHLGIGAFFRAHMAVYTDQVLRHGDRRWGICGVSQRSQSVPNRLAPQDCLYSVLVRDAEAPPRAHVVGAVREVLCAADEPDAVVERIARPSTHIVSLTVTEKGYRYNPSTRGLRADDPELEADLAGRPPRTVVGQIARGLQRRQRQGGGPVSVMSCDNLTGNGTLLRQLVSDFVARLPASERRTLATWIEESVAFPSTMVDRIVPATTDQDREQAQRLLGLHDDAVVVAEPFTQWVIEDSFAGPRPAWENAGATLTHDVQTYELVKLRLLNATHSLIAYLGVLVGYETIADAVTDPLIAGAARRLLNEDQMPTVSPPGDLNLHAYRDEVLHRFANPALGHRTTQVAMDGSQKLPQRLLGAVRERRAAGAVPRYAALLVAAWVRALGGEDDNGDSVQTDDPLRQQVAALLSDHRSARQVIDDVLSLRDVFGDDLRTDAALAESIADWYARLRDNGVHDTLRSALT